MTLLELVRRVWPGSAVLPDETVENISASLGAGPATHVSRRAFLQVLGAGVAGAALAPTLDVEQLLWQPGEKTFFLPDGYTLISPDWVTREALGLLTNHVKFTGHVRRSYDDQYATIGRNINARLPQRFVVSQADALIPVSLDAQRAHVEEIELDARQRSYFLKPIPSRIAPRLPL